MQHAVKADHIQTQLFGLGQVLDSFCKVLPSGKSIMKHCLQPAAASIDQEAGRTVPGRTSEIQQKEEQGLLFVNIDYKHATSTWCRPL